MSKSIIMRLSCIALVCLFLGSLSSAEAATKEEKRQDGRNMASTALNRLYDSRPSAREAVENAAGYAVFQNTGIKILVLGSSHGKGIAVNNQNGAETFMKMAEGQVGLGIGVTKYNVIFVFDTQDALNRFVNKGWDFGGQATAAATDSVSGGSFEGAASVSEGIWMYQMTDSGLALEIALKGTRYYKDGDLN